MYIKREYRLNYVRTMNIKTEVVVGYKSSLDQLI